MNQLIYPHLCLFVYHLNQGKEQPENLENIAVETVEGYPIDGWRYTFNLGDTDGLLVTYSVNDGNNTKPKDVNCFTQLQTKVLADKTVATTDDIATEIKIGKTWMILGVLPSSWDTLSAASIAQAAAKVLNIGEVVAGKPQKFMGATVYEFSKFPQKWQNLEAENSHLVVVLYPDQNSLETFNKFKRDWLRLFCYRHKVIWSYSNTRPIKLFLEKHFLPTEKTFDTLKVKSPELNLLAANLQQMKIALDENSKILFQYATYLSFLEVQLQTLETNLYDYQQRLISMVDKARETKTNPDANFLQTVTNIIHQNTDSNFLQAFTNLPAKKYRDQVKNDIAALTPGLRVREKFVDTIRGIVEIKEAELNESIETRDRTFQTLVGIVGVGLGTGSMVASASANFTEEIAAHPFINTAINIIPLPPSSLKLVLGFSILSGAFASFVTWLVIRWRSH